MVIDLAEADKKPQGTFSGPLSGSDVHLVREVSPEAQRACLCGHTAYLHGDRAIALCGGYSLEKRERLAYDVAIRCNCKGFEDAEG